MLPRYDMSTSVTSTVGNYYSRRFITPRHTHQVGGAVTLRAGCRRFNVGLPGHHIASRHTHDAPLSHYHVIDIHRADTRNIKTLHRQPLGAAALSFTASRYYHYYC